MLDISNYRLKHYQFADGDRVITLADPTQNTIQAYSSNLEAEWVESTFNALLPEDAKDLESLQYYIKFKVLEDYFSYHMGQLEAMFPAPGGTV